MIPSDSEHMVWFVLSHHSWMCLKLLNAIREMEFPSSSWQENSTAPAAHATGPLKDLIYWYCTHNPLPDELPGNSSKLLLCYFTISCDSFTINTDLTDYLYCLCVSQGVRAVIAESFEKIHKNHLVGMGIAPLQFLPGQNADSLELCGKERFTINIPQELTPRHQLTVQVERLAADKTSLLFSSSKQWNQCSPIHKQMTLINQFFIVNQKQAALPV